MRTFHSSVCFVLFFTANSFGCGSAVVIPAEGEDTGASATEDTGLVGDADRSSDTRDSAELGSDLGEPDTTIVTDSAVDPDTRTSDVGADTAVDPGPDVAPTACRDVATAVDPSASLDPLADGPLKVGHVTLTAPTLGPLTGVKIRVTYPTQPDGTPHTGRHAWVAFHHAVHGPFPGVIYDQYDGIFDRWASHGFVTISIDGAKVFFPTTKGTNLSWDQQVVVAGVIADTIGFALQEQERVDSPIRCLLDAKRTAVAGHSRGGGAALLVGKDASRTDGATIKGYVGFQPVDPGQTGKPATAEIPGFDRPTLFLDAGLDGDVVHPINALIHSRTRAPSVHVTILGSKHTFTLDSPFPDQGGTKATITPEEHRAMCHQYAVPFLRAFVRDEKASVADLSRNFGPAGLATTTSKGDVLFRYRPGQVFEHVARFDAAPPAGPGSTTAGEIKMAGSMTATALETYRDAVAGMGPGAAAVSKEVNSLALKWTDATAALEIPVLPAAFAGKTAIVFETMLPTADLVAGTSELVIELVDVAGKFASMRIQDTVGTGFSKRPRRLSLAYVPLSKFTGLSLGTVTKIRIRPESTSKGGYQVIDQLRLE